MEPNYVISKIVDAPVPISSLHWYHTANKLFMVSGADDAKTVYDVELGEPHLVSQLMDLPFYCLSTSPTEPLLAVKYSKGLYLIDLVLEGASARIPIPYEGAAPLVPVWSPNGKYVALTGKEMTSNTFTRLTNIIYVLQQDGSWMVSMQDPREILRISWEASGEALAIEFPYGEMMMVSSDRLRFQRYIVNKPGFTFGPKVGQAIWWTEDLGAWHLHYCQTSDYERSQIIVSFAARDDQWPQVQWSPDGRYLLIVIGGKFTEEIILYDLQNGHRTTLRDNIFKGAKSFAWAPKGHAFAFIQAGEKMVVVCNLVLVLDAV
jgi:WD40 repeat protein